MIPVYYSVRSLWNRRLSTGLTVLGLSLVVFVFATVLMLAHGIERALEAGGSEENVVVLRAGSTSEITSGVELAAVRSLLSAPEVASATGGEPLGAGERVVLVNLRAEGNANGGNITVRGIAATSLPLRTTVRLVAGRAPTPGTTEAMVGRALEGHVEGARLGGELNFANARWPVVGIFAAEGSAYESEVWTDGTRLGTVFNRPTYTSATFRVPPAQQPAFIARVENLAGYDLSAQREDEYWEEQSTALATFIRVLGLFVTFIFSAGAALGAMITMYAQVASRLRELATLRAVGFRRRSVLWAVVLESSLLGASGGLLGALAAVAMRWVEFRTLNFQTFSEVRFSFVPSVPILGAALLFGVCIGLLGGVLPAWRAARLSILDALRV